MSKQNGGEGGTIINMSSLAGKDPCFANNNFLLVIWITEVNLQSTFIIISGLKLELCWIFICFINGSVEFPIAYQTFELYVYFCDFKLWLLKLSYWMLFKHTHVYFPRVTVFQRLLWDSWSVIYVKAPLAKWKVQKEVKVSWCDF